MKGLGGEEREKYVHRIVNTLFIIIFFCSYLLSLLPQRLKC